MKEEGKLSSILKLPEIKFTCRYKVEQFRQEKQIIVYCNLPEYFPLLGNISFIIDVDETMILFPEVRGVHEDHCEARVPAVRSFHFSLSLDPDIYESWSEEKLHEYIIERTKLMIIKLMECGYIVEINGNRRVTNYIPKTYYEFFLNEK